MSDLPVTCTLNAAELTERQSALLPGLVRQCCQFLRFDLVVEAGLGPVTLTLSGPEGTADMLRSLLA